MMALLHRSMHEDDIAYAPDASFVVSLLPSTCVYVMNDTMGVHCSVIDVVCVLSFASGAGGVSAERVACAICIRWELHRVHDMELGESGSVFGKCIGRSGNRVSVSGGSVHARAMAQILETRLGNFVGLPPFAH